MKNKQTRNGKIEFYRFSFCIVILLFHIGEHLWYKNNISFNNSLDISFFAHGMIAVEFFFLVSGYFLAKEINKKTTTKKISSNTLSKEWFGYLKKKVLSIFPQHTVAFVIAIICASIFRKYGIAEIIRCLFCSIPQFFFLQMTGIRINDSYPNNVEWYISAMLVAIALIYPIYRKHKDGFQKIAAPIIAILGIGYLTSSFGKVSATIIWDKFIMLGTLRAIAIMCLGICSYELSQYIQKKKLTKKEQTVLYTIEIFSIIGTLVYIITSLSRNTEAIIVALIFAFTTFAFSNKGLLTNMFNNKFIYFLGKISLPIYLSHLPAINLTKGLFMNESIVIKVILVLIFTSIFTTITYIIGNLIGKRINKTT